MADNVLMSAVSPKAREAVTRLLKLNDASAFVSHPATAAALTAAAAAPAPAPAPAPAAAAPAPAAAAATAAASAPHAAGAPAGSCGSKAGSAAENSEVKGTQRPSLLKPAALIDFGALVFGTSLLVFSSYIFINQVYQHCCPWISCDCCADKAMTASPPW